MNLYHYSSLVAQENSAVTLVSLDDDRVFREYMAQRKEARKQKRIVARSKKKTNNSKPRRRAASTPATKWLRELICPLIYGDLTAEGVRPSVTKESFIGRWNQKLGLPSLPNYRLLDHFGGKDTLYFFGNGWKQAKRTLVMIDIDVLKSKGLGSPKGARDFANYLKTIWPNLYFETSTNGKGMHGYVVLWKWQCDAVRTNSALKRLERWLRAEAKKVNADIEQVEIKGTCPDIEFNGGLVRSVKYGYFAKLPRDVSRFAEWQDTTSLRVVDLEGAAFEVVEESAPVVAKMVAVVLTTRNMVAGSVSGKIMSEEELASIPQFEGLYREWVGPVGLKARKFIVTAHDFAVAMVILRHYKASPNCDGSLPCRRVEKLWTALFVAGDIKRPWNHHRWKAIRDFLSAKGHIDWTEHRYEYATVVQNGNEETVQKGIACKWAITDEFGWTLERVSSLPACREGEASFVDTAIGNLIPTQGNGKNLRPTPFPLRVELEQKFWFRAYEALETLYAA